MSKQPIRSAPRTERDASGPARRIDFHSHSYLSDGSTSATDMWHEAESLDHRALALTDHLSMEDPRPMLDRLHREATAWEGSAFVPLVGVEITKLPPAKIASVARLARRAGADIVIVHGESIVEKVPRGTNHAALESAAIDVLAHPGLLTAEDAWLAAENEVALEISARRGHSLTNGLVARRAIDAGAKLVVDSDAHDPTQLVALERARAIAIGAGLDTPQVEAAIVSNPATLFRRLRRGR
jgi:putative hydrolase